MEMVPILIDVSTKGVKKFYSTIKNERESILHKDYDSLTRNARLEALDYLEKRMNAEINFSMNLFKNINIEYARDFNYILVWKNSRN